MSSGGSRLFHLASLRMPATPGCGAHSSTSEKAIHAKRPIIMEAADSAKEKKCRYVSFYRQQTDDGYPRSMGDLNYNQESDHAHLTRPHAVALVGQREEDHQPREARWCSRRMAFLTRAKTLLVSDSDKQVRVFPARLSQQRRERKSQKDGASNSPELLRGSSESRPIGKAP